jgi:hypothetical protein
MRALGAPQQARGGGSSSARRAAAAAGPAAAGGGGCGGAGAAARPSAARARRPRAPPPPAAVPTAQLGRTGLEVPRICFGEAAAAGRSARAAVADTAHPRPSPPAPPKGTMLFGESTEEPEAHRLLGACLNAGVNFFDCAEMYPVPQRAETYGRSEEVLGRWLRRQRRSGRGREGVCSRGSKALLRGVRSRAGSQRSCRARTIPTPFLPHSPPKGMRSSSPPRRPAPLAK